MNAAYAATILSGTDVDPNENVKITFDGKEEAVIAPGADRVFMLIGINDLLHPSFTGAQAMANAIPEEFLK